MKRLALPLAVGIAALGLSASANAGCHLVDCVENVFITPQEIQSKSCEDLWILRNSIWDDAGYCFKSPRAMKHFPNETCRYADASAVPLNDYQRANAKTIQAAEAAHHCTLN